MADFINLSQPDLQGNEKAYVLRCLESGWISSRSYWVSRFEQRCREKFGAPALACSSGTAALWLSLKALGIEAGDRVLVPALTFAATAHAVLAVGAKPVIIDVDGDTWCLDPGRVFHSQRRKAKAIIPVTLFGQVPSGYAVPMPWTAPIIADDAQGIELDFRTAPNRLRCLSFFANKVMTTGEGGLVLGSIELIEKARLWRDHGMSQVLGAYKHLVPGMNFRMTGFQAAFGCAQLERLDQFLYRRRQLRDRYDEAFAELDLQGRGLWLYAIAVDDPKELTKFLRSHNIEARQCFPSLTSLPYLPSKSKCPVAEGLSRRVVMLPMGTHLTNVAQNRIIEAVQTFCGSS